MIVEDCTPDEFGTEDEEEAQVGALLFETVPFYNKKEGKYKLYSPDEVQSRIDDLYNEDRYEDAEELIEAHDRFKSINKKKNLRELRSKSFRLSRHQFIKAVNQGYEEDISVADVLRSNIFEKVREGLDKLGQDTEIDNENLKIFEEVVKDWSSKKGRAPLKGGYNLNWRVSFPSSLKEKYERFGQYFTKRKLLEQYPEKEKLIEILLNYYKIVEEEVHILMGGDFTELSLVRGENNEVNLKLNHQVNHWLDINNLENVDSLLSDLANEDFSEDELKEIELFEEYPSLVKGVKSLKEGEEVELGYLRDVIADESWDWDKNIEERMMLFDLDIEHPLKIKEDDLVWGEVPLRKGEVRELIMDELLEEELRGLDVDNAKDRVSEYLKEGDTKTARKISSKITTYESVRRMAKEFENIILDGISSQVVSLTMPKAVSGLVKLLDIKKEDMVKKEW